MEARNKNSQARNDGVASAAAAKAGHDGVASAIAAKMVKRIRRSGLNMVAPPSPPFTIFEAELMREGEDDVDAPSPIEVEDDADAPPPLFFHWILAFSDYSIAVGINVGVSKGCGDGLSEVMEILGDSSELRIFLLPNQYCRCYMIRRLNTSKGLDC